MKMKTVAATVAVLTTLGCSVTTLEGTPDVPASEPSVVELVPAGPPVEETRVTEPRFIRGNTWVLRLPPGWIVLNDEPEVKPPVAIELLARSREKVGKEFMFLSINTVDWDPSVGSAESFAIAAIKNVEQRSDLALINGTLARQGHSVMSLALIGSDDMVMVQVAFLSDRGYVLRCGGDPEMVDDVIKRCGKIMSTFQLASEI